MMTYLITGAAGQLGSAFVERFRRDQVPMTALTRAELDLTDRGAVLAAVSARRPDVILNCAAFNAVDRAEDEASAALAVNAFAVQSLARAARAAGAALVHYSTDFVFDGRASRPYVEEDEANPASVYGQSKLIGEWLAEDAPRVLVLRVESLFGGPAARSSIDRIVGSLRRGETARVFSDRVVTPSYVDDVVDATLRLLATPGQRGLFHCVNSGATTWAGLGLELARLLGCEPRLEQVGVADVPMRAPRPRYCALSNDKLRRAGVVMPAWQDALARYVARSP